MAAAVSLQGEIGRIISDLGTGLFGMVPYQGRADELGNVARAVVRLQDSAVEIARMHKENGGARVAEDHRARTPSRSNLLSLLDLDQTVAVTLQQVSSTVGGRASEITGSVDAVTEWLAELSLASTATRESMLDGATKSRTPTALRDGSHHQARPTPSVVAR